MIWKSHIFLSEDAETCFLRSKDELSLNFDVKGRPIS
jgi:hypothetical protein